MEDVHDRETGYLNKGSSLFPPSTVTTTKNITGNSPLQVKDRKT